MNCSFCNNEDLKSVYQPKGSRVSLTIVICQKCGLVQSTAEKSKPKEVGVIADEDLSLKKLSCDAGYSEVRVGKGQMTASAIKFIQDNIDKSDLHEVLDMCAARGHFVNAALDTFNLDHIDCMDPDRYMTLSYADDPRINLTVGKYDSLKTDKKYDLIYSCHTLEHYRDPGANIRFMIDHIKDGGYLLINVPNILSVVDGRNLDEFFYDYHKIYFNREILTSFIESFGMELVDQDKSNYTIEMLFKKTGDAGKYKIDHSFVKKNEELILQYKENINGNRSKLMVVSARMKEMMKDKRSAVLGCGRAFDTLLTYGDMKVEDFDILIDNFLKLATPELYGRKLHGSGILDSEHIDNLFLITRSSTGNLMSLFKEKYPHLNVVHINELLDSV